LKIERAGRIEAWKMPGAVTYAVSWPLVGARATQGAYIESGAPADQPKAKISAVSDASTLVSRCREGDAAAFRELFHTHKGDVARIVFRMMGSSADVEDLVQEVFLQVHRSIADFRGDARLSTWLYRLTVNVVLMHRRAAKSRPQLVGEEAAAPPKDTRMLPDEQVARRRRVIAFYRMVDKLSEKKRTVFVLHEIDGLSPLEIAKIVDAPVLTVRTRLFYARRELAAMIREEPDLGSLVADESAGLDVVAQKVREEST
jgi:RNA polymerase sigma-70 factor (ECF subfamily)